LFVLLISALFGHKSLASVPPAASRVGSESLLRYKFTAIIISK
jgi:hypothetical protein